MAKNKQEYDWLEDPFNDEKNKEAYLEAQKSQGKGCLFILLAFVAVILAFILIACLTANAIVPS